jgi:phage gp36-like protein
MIFGFFTLVVAITISAVAAYYSIVGLTSIFSAAMIPIIIMGVALEIGKVTAALWLKLNWHRANLVFKLYLIPAVAVLMLLTSMGIFGFLSRAHLDQAVPSATVVEQIAFLDEKIALEKENVNVARKALQQLDKTVDETIARSSSEDAVVRAANLRRSQQAERRRLQRDIENAQSNISKYTEQRQPLAVQLRNIEVEVGPIKYIAALIYDDNVDATTLEKAVRIVIIIIVAVFDPLALILIIAGQQSIRWAKEEKLLIKENIVSIMPEASPGPIEPTQENELVEERIFDPEKYPYLNKFEHFKNLKPMVHREEKISENTNVVNTNVKHGTVESDSKIPETAERYKAPMPTVPETLNIRKLK